jgi:hypothetical protein
MCWSGSGSRPPRACLTDSLLKVLDEDKSGTPEEAECKTAQDALRKLDTNDDELAPANW